MLLKLLIDNCDFFFVRRTWFYGPALCEGSGSAAEGSANIPLHILKGRLYVIGTDEHQAELPLECDGILSLGVRAVVGADFYLVHFREMQRVAMLLFNVEGSNRKFDVIQYKVMDIFNHEDTKDHEVLA